MAAATEATLTTAYRADVTVLRARQLRSLLEVWPLLDVTALDRTFPGWLSAVLGVVATSRKAQAQVAVSYYAALASLAGATPFDVATADSLDGAARKALVASLHATAVAQTKVSMRQVSSLEVARRLALTRSSGVATRWALAAGRDTIIGAATTDPASIGWGRVAAPTACAFCRMLVGRGTVYREATVRFLSHDHCQCTARPEFGDAAGQMATTFARSQRFRTDAARAANNARLRGYLAATP